MINKINYYLVKSFLKNFSIVALGFSAMFFLINVIDIFERIKDSEVIVICVPTPLTSDHKPDISILESALKAIAPYLRKDMLVILESTVEPGTTRNIVAPLLAKGSGLKQNEFFMAFCSIPHTYC